MEKRSNILLPIAGNGTRFSSKGYSLPKPLIFIEKDNKTILEKSLESVNYENSNLIFIVKQEHVDKFKINEFLKEKFGSQVITVPVNYDTAGAVNSCLLAEKYINNDEPLIIFTPDCYFEPQFDLKKVDSNYDGLVAVFNSDNDAHSYVVINDNGEVLKAAEKEVISSHAVGGLYYYKKGADFVKYSKKMIEQNKKVKGEFYICPVFNFLIEDGKTIGIDKNTKHVILGTPEGLETYIKAQGISLQKG